MIGWAFIVLCGMAAGLAVAGAPGLIAARVQRDAAWLSDVAMRFTPEPIDGRRWAILYNLGYLALLATLLLLTPNPLIALGLWVIALFLPKSVVEMLWQRRRRRIEQQLPLTVASMANNLHAGLTLVQSLERLGEQAPEPSRTEFRVMANRYRHGVSLEQTILEARRRLDLPNFTLFASALLVNRQMGGDVASTLDRVSQSLARLQEMHQTVEASTAEGRTNIRVLLVAPLGILLMLYFIDAEGVALLMGTIHGWAVLLLAGALTAAGGLWASRMVNQEL